MMKSPAIPQQTEQTRHTMKRHRNRTCQLGLALWLTCAAPAVTLAAPSPANPSAAGADAAGELKPKHGRPSVAASEEATWPQVQSFMEKHSKRKWAAYQKLNPEHKRALRGQLITRFGELDKLADKGNKDLYDLETQRVEIEDDIYGALSDIKRAKPGPEQEQARKELRPIVQRLVQNRMEERRLRLEKLKALAGNLEKEVHRDGNLKSDPGRFEDFIARRADEIERHGLGGAGAEARPARRHPAGERTGPTTNGSGSANPDDVPAGTADPAD